MKTILSVLLALIITYPLGAQSLDPVSWSFEVVAKSEKVYEVHFKATMEDKWAIYSQYTNDDGPIPTSFTFEDNDKITLEKGVQEQGDLISGYDTLFETDIKKFKETVDFVQTVKLNAEKTHLIGYVTYMTCNDTKCLPPRDQEFSIKIK